VRDPLLRDPHAVERDIAEGVVSTDSARSLYGVVFAADGSIDLDATQLCRIAMRGERNGPDFGPHGTCMSHAACKERLEAPGGEELGIRERLMSTIARAYTTGPKTMLSEIVCRKCGALLDAQVTMQGAQPLFDGHGREGSES
jgi:hypothetical protein